MLTPFSPDCTLRHAASGHYRPRSTSYQETSLLLDPHKSALADQDSFTLRKPHASAVVVGFDDVEKKTAMATLLIIERDSETMRLLALGMQQMGHHVLVSAGADELVAGDRVRPDVIVFNTGMAMDIKRLWVRSLRYIAPEVDIIDLRPASDGSAYDTEADGYLEPPYRIDNLVTLVESLQQRRAATVVAPSDTVPV